MARAIVSNFVDMFGVPQIKDDATNGWSAKFNVFFIGAGARDGFMFEEFEVHFADTDGAIAMDNKIRDAARARAVELNITGGSTLSVVSFLPPRRL